MWAWPSLWGRAQAHNPPATNSRPSINAFPDICAVSGPVRQEEVACPLGLDWFLPQPIGHPSFVTS